jgi:undecaprenyl diphosphate synthase
MRVRIIGRREKLPEDIVEKIDNLEKETTGNTGLQFTVAINYGGRDEITRTVQKLAAKCVSGEIRIEDIDENLVSASLDTYDITDPDLLIRTSGELRTSNFLPWQLAYSEFYFTDVLWPDFGMDDLIEAVKYYSGRDRRYGGVKK